MMLERNPIHAKINQRILCTLRYHNVISYHLIYLSHVNVSGLGKILCIKVDIFIFSSIITGVINLWVITPEGKSAFFASNEL